MDSSLLGWWLLWRVWHSTCCNRREKGEKTVAMFTPFFTLWARGFGVI